MSRGTNVGFVKCVKRRRKKMLNLKDKVSDGKIFSVTFIKRTTGELRLMVARTGVDRREPGSRGRVWQDEEKGVLTVWDVQKGAYRCIPLENVREVKHHGKVEEINV
jgi:hypothetical protein